MENIEVIRKFANLGGVPDQDAKIFFEIFLRKIFSYLKTGKYIRVPELGSYEYLPREMSASGSEGNIPDVISFLPEGSKSAELIFPVPAETPPAGLMDEYFSLSFGKPLIPLKGVPAGEFPNLSGSEEYLRILETRIEIILKNSEISERRNEEVFLPGREFSRQSSEVNWKSADTAGITFQKNEPEVIADEESISWDFGEDLSDSAEINPGFITGKEDEVFSENIFPAEDLTGTAEQDSEGSEDLNREDLSELNMDSSTYQTLPDSQTEIADELENQQNFQESAEDSYLKDNSGEAELTSGYNETYGTDLESKDNETISSAIEPGTSAGENEMPSPEDEGVYNRHEIPEETLPETGSETADNQEEPEENEFKSSGEEEIPGEEIYTREEQDSKTEQTSTDSYERVVSPAEIISEEETTVEDEIYLRPETDVSDDTREDPAGYIEDETDLYSEQGGNLSGIQQDEEGFRESEEDNTDFNKINTIYEENSEWDADIKEIVEAEEMNQEKEPDFKLDLSSSEEGFSGEISVEPDNRETIREAFRSAEEKEERITEDYKRRSSKLLVVIGIVTLAAAAIFIYFYLKQQGEKNISAYNVKGSVAENAVIIERSDDIPVSSPYSKESGITIFNGIDPSLTAPADRNESDKPAVQNNQNNEEGVSGIQVRNPEQSTRVQGYIYRYKDFYAVQVSSWKSLSIAQSETAKFLKSGYEAFVEEARVNNETYYRVRVGGFKTLQDAENFWK